MILFIAGCWVFLGLTFWAVDVYEVNPKQWGSVRGEWDEGYVKGSVGWGQCLYMRLPAAVIGGPILWGMLVWFSFKDCK